jgi:hypothetical protein
MPAVSTAWRTEREIRSGDAPDVKIAEVTRRRADHGMPVVGIDDTAPGDG